MSTTARTLHTLRTTPQIFVLWSDQFDDMIANTFISQLRWAGLPVQIVGVPGPITTRVHGATIRPDISIEEAQTLVEQAASVIIPCDFSIFAQAMRDSRLREYLRQAEANGSQFAGHEDVIEQLSIVKIHDRAIDWVYTDDRYGITELARLLAREMLTQTAQA